MKKNLLYGSLLLCSTISYAQQGVGFKDGAMRANNSVFCMAQSGNTLYMGGLFTAFSSNTLYGVPLNATTGYPKPVAANYPNGIVYACVADGNGGWYIGGQFTSVGGQTRNRLARINADGSLHAWNPNANNEIYALAVDGQTVYVAGGFGQIGGQNRSYVAAVDAATGAVKTWNPGANGSVSALDVSGNTVYVGGYFTQLKGATRNRLAAVDTASGSGLRDWNPNVADGQIGQILVNGATAYVTGAFTTVSGVSRAGIAAIDTTGTGTLKAWNPSPNGAAGAMRLSGSTMYVGGAYTNIAGVVRNRLAGIDTAGTGTATSFNPNMNADVIGIDLVGSTIYAGGAFTTAGGVSRSKGAAFDTTGAGTLKDWSPGIANNNIYKVVASGGYIYAAGNFTSTSITRNRLAAIDVTTGELTSWNPSADALVHTIQVSGDKVYFGGQFTSINGTGRNKGAAVTTAGTLTPWNPNVTGAAGALVANLAVNGNSVYLGGYYNAVGGTGRNNLSSVDTGSGTLRAWNPNMNNEVFSVVVSGSTVYAGGGFTTVGGGTARGGIAAYDTNGTLKAWNPNANSSVVTVAISGTTAYLGGYFTNIGGQSRNRLAAFDTAGAGTLKAWNPNADNYPTSISISGNTAYLAGVFGTVGGTARTRLAAVDTVAGTLKTWTASPDGHVRSVLASSGNVYVAGDFTAINGNNTRVRFMAMTDSVALTACTPGLAATSTPSCTIANNTGTINLTVTGGYAPYTYSWTGANGFTATTEDITGLATGSYSVTVTSTGGCTASTTVNVAVQQAVTPTASVTAPGTICYLSQTTFTASGTNLGNAPVYTWYRNGVQVPDTIGNTYITSNISKYANENVYIKVTNINAACATSVSATSDTVTRKALNTLDPNTTFTTASRTTKLCAGDTVTFTSKSASVAGATFSWAIDGQPISGATDTSFTTGQAGIVTATVTSAEGCTRSADRTINALPMAAAMALGSTVFCPGDSVILDLTPVDGATYRWKQDATSRGIVKTQVAKTAGNYTVTVTKNGCAATSTPIAVAPRVTNIAVTATTPTTVCTPNVVTLQATQDAGYTYQWYRSSIAVSGATSSAFSATTSGNYKVELSNNGCAPKTSLSTTATINTAPSAVITKIVNGYAYNTLRATGTGTGVSYQWHKNDTAIAGATVRDYIATTSGSYRVMVTKGTCSEYSATPYTVTLANGAKFTAVAAETAIINIFPNPSTGIFNIGSEEPVNVVVKDVQGRIVADVKNASSIDLSNQPVGMYIMSIANAEGKLLQVERVVKQ
jgi:hypothetical protein